MMVTKTQTRRLLALCDELLTTASDLSVALFDAQAAITGEDATPFLQRVATAHESAELLCARIQAMHNAALALDTTEGR